ncbi:MAG: FKBP-type peptidyl-prolyl cis-trans isomerase [Fimbriiglobus sp.]|jgi:FKBP-type peptidyl-prolyl cis-trans isomerase|nr:FKBP-type peptidyl-prolyl cis-trans isomerase [Fimbriiglobus sp.]
MATDPFALPDLNNPGWTARPDGMKVWDVVEGTGDECPAGATVTVHYTGWLLNGTVFDSSRKRGQTISFGLHQVIKGWTVGVPGMKKGGKRLLHIPPEMAYGSRGAGRDIPPNSTLVFEIELTDFRK